MSDQTRRKLLATCGGTLVAGLAGCSQGESPDESAGEATEDTTDDGEMGGEMTPDEMGRLRVAHLSPDAPNVDIYADGSKALSDVSFRTVSDYLSVPAGARTIKITAAGDESTAVFEGDVPVAADTDYTVAAIGELQSEETAFEPLVLEDDNSEPDSETARVRIVHASPDAPAVDVTTAGSNTALADGAVFGDATGYAEVPAGEYTLQIRGDTESNDGDIVDTYTVSLTGGTVYTAFAGGYLSPGDESAESPFDLTLTADAGAGGGGIVDTGSVRIAHMSPDAPNVDVYVDGERALSDVPFRAVGEYLSVPAGSRTIKTTAAGDESTVAFEGSVPIDAGTDYTISAIGELQSEDTAFEPLVLEDDRSNPGADTARVRLVHASPDAPAVDVTLAADGTAVFDGVGFGGDRTQLVPAGEFTLQIRGDTESNDGDVVAEFDLSLSGGTVYTVYAAGYLSPGDEAVGEQFDLTVAADASY